LGDAFRRSSRLMVEAARPIACVKFCKGWG
jgi:hypothetical protein